MYINELDELEDILEIIGEDTSSNNYTPLILPDEYETILESCIEMMYEYITDNSTLISTPTFHDDMMESMLSLLTIQCEPSNPFEKPINYDEEIQEELANIMNMASELFYSTCIPQRSFPGTFETPIDPMKRRFIKNQLEYLNNIPQAPQRTPEWYQTRFNLITASNAYKVFESQSVQNAIIYEKCVQPLIKNNSGPTNVNTPMHWGQKYEPISTMYYEYIYNAPIGEYGCIPHHKYHFLGASPDGIVNDPTSSRYGRMLEIKNIVNREIDGIPKKEYWIQMQLQMENCDLDECDFLETRFKEYDDQKAFTEEDNDFFYSEEGDMKGIIMYFSGSSGNAIYMYKPLNMDIIQFEQWEQEQMLAQETLGNTWIKNIYWRLDEVSCVLVMRNRKWFLDNVDQMEMTWDTILKERISGFEHRKPNKRIKKYETDTVCASDMSCDLSIDKDTGKVSIVGMGRALRSNSCIEDGIILHFRTESMDETKDSLQKT